MFKPGIEDRPGFHATLRQSVENPAQRERLPRTHSLTLEHRTRLASAAERRTLYLRLIWAVTWRAALLAAGKFLSAWEFGLANAYFTLLVFIGLVSVARGLLAQRSALVRGLVYGVLCPSLVLPALVVDIPYYDLALAFVALSLLADRLAAHHLYSLSAPLRLRRRTWLRRAWHNRFAPFRAPRLTAYGVAAVWPLVFFGVILYRRQRPVEYVFVDDLYVLGGALLVGLLAMFLFEPTVNFLYRQPIKYPWTLVGLTWRTLWDWSSYNYHDRALPGVFTSPGGPIRARLNLLFGAALLLAAPVVELTFCSRLADLREQQAREPRAEASQAVLQPYQRALLERMTPQERAEYLSARVPEPKPVAEDDELVRALGLEGIDIEVSRFTMVALAGPMTPSLLALIPALTLATLLLLVALAPAVARVDSEARQFGAKGVGDQPRLDAAMWERFVTELRHARHDSEPTSLFIGMNAADDSPVVVPRRVFEEHAHYLGDSGSGKTTLGLAPLISQLIRARDCSVVVIDLKGDDRSLFENARLEAQRAGLRFRWFTNELGKATYVFNPLLQRHLSELSLYQRTDLLTASLGLQYGTDYGRGFFSDANAELLYHALRARPQLASFRELSQVLKEREPFRTVSAQLKMAGSHLAAIVTRLGSTEALNARPGAEASADLLAAAIDMRQAFEEPQVIHFHLASALGTATSAEIARMAMFSLLSAAKFVDGKRKQVFLVVDEFQRAVSNNLELFLQTARSMNIGVILANQSLSDLKKPGVDIVSTVRTNTRYRQLFAVGEMHDLQEVILTSGETLLHRRSWNEALGLTLVGAAGVLRSRNFTEEVSPRLRVNDLLLASDHPLQSVCHVRRGEGFAQYGGMPFIIQSTYHISPEEYGARKRSEWPVQTGETFTPTLATTDPIAAHSAPTVATEPPESDAAQEAANRLFKDLDATYQEQVAARRRATGADDPTTES